MAKGDDLQERFVDFAVGIIMLCKKLPNDLVGKHIGDQLLRSGTSPAANYSEARGAESKRDFIHKLRIALKELNETGIWLSILDKTSMSDGKKIKALTDECSELSKIIGASIQTVQKRKTR